jgi:hypothetical protein
MPSRAPGEPNSAFSLATRMSQDSARMNAVAVDGGDDGLVHAQRTKKRRFAQICFKVGAAFDFPQIMPGGKGGRSRAGHDDGPDGGILFGLIQFIQQGLRHAFAERVMNALISDCENAHGVLGLS